MIGYTVSRQMLWKQGIKWAEMCISCESELHERIKDYRGARRQYKF